MTNLKVQNYNNNLVIDSRLIAEELGIQHKSFKDLIRTYLVDFEEFGNLAATSVGVAGTNGYAEFYYLNEDQAYLSLTYSKNSPQVRIAKVNLVKAFKYARQTKLPQNYIQSLELLLASEKEKERLLEETKLLTAENEELTEFKNEVTEWDRFIELLDITRNDVSDNDYPEGISVYEYLIAHNNNPDNAPIDPELWSTISKRSSSYFRLLEGRHPDKSKNRNIFAGKKLAYILATIQLVQTGV